ncbi:MAG: hypothetical protein E6G66_11730 [Actinobacteria bacterium]|nr:MAG: hypothetical protein E6G66_11730 [Actinomycetota bacterium]
MWNTTELTEFATNWFQLLSDRAPAETLKAMLVPEGLEMVFPDATIHNYEDFDNWYRAVGENVDSQQHILESLEVTRGDDAGADLSIIVIWKARQLADGRDVAFRATQAWSLVRTAEGAGPIIKTYRVLTLDPLESEAATS